MEKYGLIGYPLRHSFSIGYFNEKFKSEGINAEYVNFEIPSINNFMEVIEENPNLCGLNVTIPYKEQVIPFGWRMILITLTAPIFAVSRSSSSRKGITCSL